MPTVYRPAYINLIAALFLLSSPAYPSPQEERYIVVLEHGAGLPKAVAEDVARRANGRIRYVYEHALRGFSITLPYEALTGVIQDPRIAYIEADISVTASAQEIPTGVARIFAHQAALDIDEMDDYRVDADVAILDTGIDRQHPDLNVVGGANCLEGPEYTCDANQDGDDDHYHGTHVAGTVGALDSGIGVIGTAPGARLWAVKVLDQYGSGSLAGVIAGIDWAVAQNTIEVINMSLSGSGTSTAMDEAIYNAVQSGVSVVVSAGNSDDEAANYTPANAPDAITVSALADFDGLAGGLGSPTCSLDQDDTLADFSNWGAVDITAPGACILSTLPIEQGEYGTLSGTSMAAPHVAGAAALLASNGNDPTTIRSTLFSSGNYDWTDDSGDGIQEPLLDITGYTPTLVSSDINNPPTASFNYACINLSCDFTDTSSDTDGMVVNWLWDFGDGNTATVANPTQTYSTKGTYDVILTVTDDIGDSDLALQSVSVSPGGSDTPDACDGLNDGVHLSPSSTNQGRTWTAIVDAVNCSGSDVVNFSSVSVIWSPKAGPTTHDCSISTGICRATQSDIRKQTGSVKFSFNDNTTTIYKP